MGFEGKVVKGTLLEKLADRIEQRIRSGELADGDRMPPEGTLAADYGVSRTLAREALAILRTRGYLETINGRGTFVRHPDASQLADAFVGQTALSGNRPLTADDLYEARTAIETTAARLAAERATPEDIEKLSKMLEEMIVNVEIDVAAYTKADFGFHLAIAQASGNPLLPTLLGPLVRIIVEGVFESASDPDAAQAGIRDHSAILRAIQKGDGKAAARTIESHLVSSRNYYPQSKVQLTAEKTGER
jgi:GntR family transcriptional regulator, transcriptional repressor for pyruvate dehydrogenase complex